MPATTGSRRALLPGFECFSDKASASSFMGAKEQVPSLLRLVLPGFGLVLPLLTSPKCKLGSQPCPSRMAPGSGCRGCKRGGGHGWHKLACHSLNHSLKSLLLLCLEILVLLALEKSSTAPAHSVGTSCAQICGSNTSHCTWMTKAILGAPFLVNLHWDPVRSRTSVLVVVCPSSSAELSLLLPLQPLRKAQGKLNLQV